MAAAFIAGDWGTSHLRLSLCDAAGHVLESREGPGIAQVKGRVEAAFFEETAHWGKHGKLPVILGGMAGSTMGWRETVYLPCPIAPQALVPGLLHFEARGHAVTLTPGLSCRNPLDAPDVMRGEETQILGALRLNPSLRQGRRILCLPGTHTKWVSMLDGVIENFLTALSGELYNILHKHSVLVNGEENPVDELVFIKALKQTQSLRDGELIHLLFQTRSRQLCGELDPPQAASFLSGLVIGQDVSGALQIFPGGGQVTVIGAPGLAALYEQALKVHGIESEKICGDAASLEGLTALHHAAREDMGHVI